MEIINIDSSDDESVPPVKAATGGGRVANALRRSVTQTTQDTTTTQDEDESDDSSVSSADSIWETSGLQSKPKKADATRCKSSDVPPPVESDGELEIVGQDSGRDANAATNAVMGGNATTKASFQKKTDAATGGRSGLQSSSVDNARTNPKPSVDVWLGSWKVMLLMDHREFGMAPGSKFLKETEKKINNHFGGVHCETLALPSADYMYVARLISNTNGEVIDERVLDMVIERKNVNDLQQCLILDSKKYKPLKFFEAQMYKLQHCGISKKLFLMEGDEDNPRDFSVYSSISQSGVAPKFEQEKRLKRVKTMRLSIARGEYRGIEVLSTKSKHDTVKFLIQQLDRLMKSFDPQRPPPMTMESLKEHINEQMKAPTFCEYLRQRSIPKVGDVRAMKVIMDPKLDWDKNFNNEVFTKKGKSKSTLEDRATFWGESAADTAKRNLTNARESKAREKRYSGGVYLSKGEDKDGNPSCSICRKTIDIFDDTAETEISTCNRVVKCGEVFHKACLAAQGYDISKSDGCILCKGVRNFTVKSNDQACKKTATKKNTGKSKSASAPSLGNQDSSNGSNAKASSLASLEKRAGAPKGRKSNTTKPSTTTASTTATSKKKSDASMGKQPNTTNAYHSATTSLEKETPEPKKRKRGPTQEKVYINLPPMNQQLKTTSFRTAAIDRSGFDRSVAAALLLGDEAPTDSDYAFGSAKKKKNATSTESKAIGKKKTPSGATTDKEDASCGLCCKPMVERDMVLCNRVDACGGTFHNACIKTLGYNIQLHDGCILCEKLSNFSTEKKVEESKTGRNAPKPASNRVSLDNDGIVVIDSDEEKDDDVIVID